MHKTEQRVYKYWQALYLSFYSRQLYLDVAKRWRGYGLCYFLWVISLAAIPISVKTLLDFKRYYEEQLIQPLQKMPSLTISHGQLQFDYFMPFLIKNRSGHVVVIIDAAADLPTIQYAYPDWMMVVNKETLYFRPPQFSILHIPAAAIHYETLPFRGIVFESFNPSRWLAQSHLLQQKWLFMGLIYPLFIGVLFGFFTGFLALMAIMGKVLSHTVFRLKIGFKEAYRLMVVAAGSGVSLFTIGLNYAHSMPWMGFCLMVLIAGYFSFALLTLRRERRQLAVG